MLGRLQNCYLSYMCVCWVNINELFFFVCIAHTFANYVIKIFSKAFLYTSIFIELCNEKYNWKLDDLKELLCLSFLLLFKYVGTN